MMKKQKYYTVVAYVYVERVEGYQRMAGYVPAITEDDARNLAKAYCMERYKCPMYKMNVEAVSEANDQELAENLPFAIDSKSYEEMLSSDGLFSVEEDILDLIILDDEKCPTLKIGEWIIHTEEGLWGIDAFSFATKQEAEDEAMGDIYLSKEIKQLTSDNVMDYQEMLQKSWESDTEL